MNKERIKEKLNKVKELIKSKEGITLVGVITLLLVITIINVAVKDTHAYYNSVTDPVQIFNGKVGNFKPRIDSFYIKENNVQPKYTNVSSNIVYLTPGNNNSNLDQVCITETDDISTCDNKWQNITENNQYSYTFLDVTEGPKVIFGFVKDKYGNKSVSRTDTITYDVTPPTVQYSLSEGTYTGSQTLTITPRDNLTGVGYWVVHVYKDGAIVEQRELTGQPSYTVTLTEGSSWTVYASIYDNAGNLITQQPNNGTWYYQNYTVKPKSVKNYLDKYATGATGVKTLQDDLVDGLYRYYGTASQVTNNYICLGPTAVDTCQDGNDMYRIIGITTDGKLKVIKAIEYGVTQKWFSINTNGTWKDTLVYKYLNEDFYNSINERIQGLIEYHTWNMELMGQNPWPSTTPTSSSISEGTVGGNIGLMYATDYVNAGPSTSGNFTNWLFITNGWKTSSLLNYAASEWTMTRRGYIDEYYAWILYRGSLYLSEVLNPRMVRPVFYLTPNITLTGGGTESDPFRIL